MLLMCLLTGMMCTMKISVLGAVCFVTMTASLLFLCKPFEGSHFLHLLSLQCFANLVFINLLVCVFCEVTCQI